MNAIRVKTHIDSETLHLPELSPLIGMDVEIIVIEDVAAQGTSTANSGKGWFDRHFGAGWPDKIDDGFEKTLEEWRRTDRPADVPE